MAHELAKGHLEVLTNPHRCSLSPIKKQRGVILFQASPRVV